jgi:hypothetical protein
VHEPGGRELIDLYCGSGAVSATPTRADHRGAVHTGRRDGELATRSGELADTAGGLSLARPTPRSSDRFRAVHAAITAAIRASAGG